MGNVIQAGVKMNPARQAGVKSGLPVAVPALTVNRVCGSGAQAIVTAAAEIGLGLIDTAVAGGMENMDRAPYLLTEGRWGYRMGHSPVFDALLYDGLNDAFSGEHSGWHTEDLVTKHQITREEQDRWALRSQQRFARRPGRRQVRGRDRAGRGQDAQGSGRVRQGRAQSAGHHRREPRQAQARLPQGRDDHRGQRAGAQHGGRGDVRGRAGLGGAARRARRWRGWSAGASAPSSPGMFGIGPVPAVRQALERAGWAIGDVERIEINEAFAAIALACMRELGLPEEIANVEGGAIAHGHAIGATGAVLTTRILHSMQRDGIKRGVVTMCIGGGQGIALCVEALR